MSASRRFARFNIIANRIVGPGLTRLPGFGTVVHRGRRSGREYRTPVRIFRTGDGYLISLPYGAESDWVRNVVAAGGCELLTRGRRMTLAEPAVFDTSVRASKIVANIPVPLRAMLALFGVTQFIQLRTVTARVAGRR